MFVRLNDELNLIESVLKKSRKTYDRTNNQTDKQHITNSMFFFVIFLVLPFERLFPLRMHTYESAY